MYLKNILYLTDDHDKKLMNNWKTKNGYEIKRELLEKQYEKYARTHNTRS